MVPTDHDFQFALVLEMAKQGLIGGSILVLFDPKATQKLNICIEIVLNELLKLNYNKQLYFI